MLLPLCVRYGLWTQALVDPLRTWSGDAKLLKLGIVVSNTEMFSRPVVGTKYRLFAVCATYLGLCSAPGKHTSCI